MRIGMVLGDSSGGLIGMIDQIVQAEADGFDNFSIGQVFGVDALTLIALAGQRTSRIDMITAVVPTYARHPYVMAQQAMTTQAATNGRLTLGIGLSHKPVIEGMWGMSYEHPAQHMREYLSVLLPLMREGKVAFKGEVFSVNAPLQVPVPKPPQVLIAALAPMMLRIAGELADGTATWMTGVKTIGTHVAPRINAAAKNAGRPAPRIVCALPVVVTEDVQTAKERAARLFQMYGTLPNYQRMLKIEGAESPGDVTIAGDDAAVERQLRDLASAGVTDFSAGIFPVGDDAAGSVARTRALVKSLIGKL